MKIAVINITRGGMSGGYGKYLLNVIPRMASNRAVKALLCASPQSLNIKNWFDEPLSNVEFVNCKPFRFMRHNPDQELKQHLDKFLPDVIFLPIERFFRFNKVPIVNMVQNMLPYVKNLENPIAEKIRLHLKKRVAFYSIKKADKVVAVSGYVRDYIHREIGLPLNRISLVYHGIDFKNEVKPSLPLKVPASYEKRFIFTAGSLDPYRGVEDLVQALKFVDMSSFGLEGVVIAGGYPKRMRKYVRMLKDMTKEVGLSSGIVWAGHLSQNEMAWCYRNATIFVMTSRVESFGQIGLEAMAEGCISVVADNPCLPEIFEKAAIYYEPRDPKSLHSALMQGLNLSKNSAEKLRSYARSRARKFSWDICAQRTVDVLKAAANTNGSVKDY